MGKGLSILQGLILAVVLAGASQGGTFRTAKLKTNPVIGGTYEPAGMTPRITYPGFTASPGESLDFTYFDQQQICSVGRMIVQDRVSVGGLHVIYLKSPNSTHTPRNAAYQFNDRAGGGWTGEIDANTARTGPVNIDVLSDGRAVVVFNQAGGSGNRTVAAVDASRGAGAFTVTSVDTVTYPPGSGAPIWTKVAVGPTDLIHVTGCGQTNACIYYIRWTPGDTTARWITVDSLVNPLSNVVFASRSSGKVAIAYTKPRPSSPNGQTNMDLWYRESTNHGLTWGPKVNVTNYLNSDTVRAYCDVSGIYDNGDTLHLVWSGQRVIGDTAYYTASAIFHWSQATGISLVSGPGHNLPGTFWWSLPGKPGSWSMDVTRPSLSVDASEKLYCVWSGQVQPNDTSAGGYVNMDLYGRGSVDNGLSWGAFGRTDTMICITNSHTPGGLPGACDDDRFPSITKVTTDSVRIFWMEDRDAGSSVNGEGAVVSCPMKYLAVKTDWFWPLIGVEERKALPSPVSPFTICVSPNPFTSFSSVPGYEVDRFSLYDVSGRKVGTYLGDRIGNDLGPGVYFLKFEHGQAKPFRIVKVK